jgi:hypothetical protein
LSKEINSVKCLTHGFLWYYTLFSTAKDRLLLPDAVCNSCKVVRIGDDDSKTLVAGQPTQIFISGALYKIFSMHRVGHGYYFMHRIGRKAATPRMFADGFFVRRYVYAVPFVGCDVGMEPLNLRTHAYEHVARFLRNFLQLYSGELVGARQVSFDDVFGHSVFIALLCEH